MVEESRISVEEDNDKLSKLLVGVGGEGRGGGA